MNDNDKFYAEIESAFVERSMKRLCVASVMLSAATFVLAVALIVVHLL